MILNFAIDNRAREALFQSVSRPAAVMVIRRASTWRDGDGMSFDCQVFVEICDTPQ